MVLPNFDALMQLYKCCPEDLVYLSRIDGVGIKTQGNEEYLEVKKFIRSNEFVVKKYPRLDGLVAHIEKQLRRKTKVLKVK